MKEKKKVFLTKKGINKINSKSKIIKIIKIKKKLIEKFFIDVLSKFWKPLSICKISFFFLKPKFNNIIKTKKKLIKKINEIIFFY